MERAVGHRVGRRIRRAKREQLFQVVVAVILIGLVKMITPRAIAVRLNQDWSTHFCGFVRQKPDRGRSDLGRWRFRLPNRDAGQSDRLQVSVLVFSPRKASRSQQKDGEQQAKSNTSQSGVFPLQGSQKVIVSNSVSELSIRCKLRQLLVSRAGHREEGDSENNLARFAAEINSGEGA